jgi:hypothetical protein
MKFAEDKPGGKEMERNKKEPLRVIPDKPAPKGRAGGR